MQLSNFLRTVLKLDAATCLGMAALVLPLAPGLEPVLGIDALFARSAAASLIPIGLFMLWVGTRRETNAAFVWLIILGNLAWTAGSLLVAAELPGITEVGQALVIAQGLGVLGLAVAEWAGLRGSSRTLNEASA